MSDIGKTLIFCGVVLIGLGCLVFLAGKVPGFGKMPGDIFIERGNFKIYFPIVTCLVLSLLLTLLINLFGRR